jgi:hypothetical protein
MIRNPVVTTGQHPNGIHAKKRNAHTPRGFIGKATLLANMDVRAVQQKVPEGDCKRFLAFVLRSSIRAILHVMNRDP